MPDHETGTRQQWRTAYEQLRAQEKELTRRSDELARQRQALPWVPVTKEYRFDTNDGEKSLAELFDGRSQLIIRHFMHGPKTPQGCPGCTFETDNLVGAVPHLAHRDVTFILASRSPLATLNEYKRRFGWDIEWVCMGDNGFNDDFFEIMRVDSVNRANVQTLRGQGLIPDDYERSAGSMLDVMELMALSCFALDEGTVYHTYSTYDRGTDALNATWQLLDRAPNGRGTTFDNWPRKRDEY